MTDNKKSAIHPLREEDYSGWYHEVIKQAELADYSPVKGCMVIRPWGYKLWERMRRHLDDAFEKEGVDNAYFPLFIPLSHLQKEADHVEGFATECAVVTHHRLDKNADGQLQPAGQLEEPLVVRPTSETMIGSMFSKWVQSYRDLPIKINQWANVVRWEMRTRMFLRTTEFLWQEGHTAHASSAEAQQVAKRMLLCYQHFMETVLAIPVVTGEKTAAERFPGALNTYCVEGLMQDNKALQLGTSHFLGQNFSNANQITFQDENKVSQYAWTTSWGVSTRMIGGLVMTHSDDDGLICPPRIAPSQVVILPIAHKEEDRQRVWNYAQQVADSLSSHQYAGEPVRVHIDSSEGRGGEKAWAWVKKGAPIRVEIGPREVDEQTLTVTWRIDSYRDRQTVAYQEWLNQISDHLATIQQTLLDRAKQRLHQSLHRIDDPEELEAFFAQEKPAGWVLVPWSNDPVAEKALKEDWGVTVRCLPDEWQQDYQGKKCVKTGGEALCTALLAKAY